MTSPITFKNFLESVQTVDEDQLLHASINDKGKLKALFVIGLPGSGKSYTVKRIGGNIGPIIINTDRAAEHKSKVLGVPITSDTWVDMFQDSALRVTSNVLYHATNGLLPLFVDGTAGDASAILRRAGILEGLGYDVGLVWVHASLDTAKRRARDRAKEMGREVDEEFIEHVHRESLANYDYLKGKFSFFTVYKNDVDILDDTEINRVYKQSMEFFNGPVENVLGIKHIERIHAAKEKYMVPTILSEEKLKSKLKGWY